MRKAKFQTEVDIPDYGWKTGYEKKHLFMGSCFTENVGNKMSVLKYQADINPFGILYNPLSVANGLEILLEKRLFSENDLIQHQGLWHSFSHHGRFSALQAEEALEKINERIKQSSEYLNKCDYFFMTFGTAWIYRYKKTGMVVSNCHKIPSGEFIRERLSVNEIVEKYTGLLNRIWDFNPELKVVFTVSPIRHWKDGAIENQRSKAALLLAIDELTKNFGEEKTAYFPSYEIVMDELRDYRFYAEDMLHLNEIAVNHIWDIFEQAFIEKKSHDLAKKVQKIMNAVNHRPINKSSLEFLNFLESLLKKISELESYNPFLNLKLEKDCIKEQIENFNQSKNNM